MTIKDLIGKGPDELEKMDDATLRQWCEPYLRIATHVEVEQVNEQNILSLEDSPEEIKDKATKKKQATARKKVDLMAEIREMAKIHGIDIDQIPTGIK